MVAVTKKNKQTLVRHAMHIGYNNVKAALKNNVKFQASAAFTNSECVQVINQYKISNILHIKHNCDYEFMELH